MLLRLAPAPRTTAGDAGFLVLAWPVGCAGVSIIIMSLNQHKGLRPAKNATWRLGGHSLKCERRADGADEQILILELDLRAVAGFARAVGDRMNVVLAVSRTQ